MLHVPGLYLLEDELKGRCIYTSVDLQPNDLIEICPIIKIPSGQLKHIDQTKLYDYYFLWEEEGFEACIALGYGSLYNHSSTPNAEVIMDYDDGTIRIEATQSIKASSEILIDYTGGTRDVIKLWFEVKED